MLALQRAAGNRATTAALGRASSRPAYVPARCGEQPLFARAAQRELRRAVVARKKDKVCDSPGFARTVSLQPVFFRAGGKDKAPTGKTWKARFAAAKTIWAKLGVTFTALTPIVKDDAALKTAGNDFSELSTIARTQGGAGIEVFMVDNDLDFRGGRGGATVNAGSEDAKVVLSDRGGNTNLLAHELGHVLGIMHPTSKSNPGDAGSIMEPSVSNETKNPSLNSIGNYFAIQWPPAGDETCLKPDPRATKK